MTRRKFVGLQAGASSLHEPQLAAAVSSTGGNPKLSPECCCSENRLKFWEDDLQQWLCGGLLD
jgi:hypothetical protein